MPTYEPNNPTHTLWFKDGTKEYFTHDEIEMPGLLYRIKYFTANYDYGLLTPIGDSIYE